MSVVFNEAALHFLLEDEAGPVGLKLRLVSETIEENYQAAVAEVWGRSPWAQPEVGRELVFEQFGLQAEIGIRDPGVVRSDPEDETFAQYTATKFAGRERDKFLPKIMDGWDDQL